MIALVQRVSEAAVEVDGRLVGAIGPGVLALVAIVAGDSTRNATRLAERLAGYRVFPDEAGRMNRSVAQIGGGLLLVPQFTLAADTSKGMRPSLSGGAAPASAVPLFEALVAAASQHLATVATGVFGADMKVRLVNDGPVTFWLTA